MTQKLMPELNNDRSQNLVALLFAGAMLLTSVLFMEQSQAVTTFLISVWMVPFFALRRKRCSEDQAARSSSS